MGRQITVKKEKMATEKMGNLHIFRFIHLFVWQRIYNILGEQIGKKYQRK